HCCAPRPDPVRWRRSIRRGPHPTRWPQPAARDSSAPYWRGQAPAKPRARRGPGGSYSRARTRSWSSALTEGKATDYSQLGPSRTASPGEWLKAGGWRLEAGGWRLEAGGWRLEAGGWRLEAGGWRVCELTPTHSQAFSSSLPAS